MQNQWGNYGSQAYAGQQGQQQQQQGAYAAQQTPVRQNSALVCILSAGTSQLEADGVAVVADTAIQLCFW